MRNRAGIGRVRRAHTGLTRQRANLCANPSPKRRRARAAGNRSRPASQRGCARRNCNRKF